MSDHTPLPLRECTVRDIYLGDKIEYIIPIYQRNYAWGKDEIEALVQDVNDSMIKNIATGNHEIYHIGTLVTHQRDNHTFEVIDGQQRLTTILLLLRALEIEEHEFSARLTFRSRPSSKKALESIPNFYKGSDEGIINGYRYAKDVLTQVQDINKFKDFFLNYVSLVHYTVPEDVDLNHYFEVMNSRGEQLEKHEIVKSKLMALLLDDAAGRKFSKIWDAAAEMDTYIQHSLNMFKNIETTLIRYRDFGDLPDGSDSKIITGKILALMTLQGDISSDQKPQLSDSRKFQPIIDFPNFLLIVLKLTLFRERLLTEFNARVRSGFSLDDKELLNAFDVALSLFPDKLQKDRFARLFLYNLWKSRFLLDNYIVHHQLSDWEEANRNPWELGMIKKEDDSERFVNLSTGNLERQLEMINLLSLLEVTFTPKQRKNYLLYVLLYLFEDTDLDNYLKFLRNLVDKYFYDVYLNSEKLADNRQPRPDAFDSVMIPEGKLCTQIINMSPHSEFLKIYPVGSANIPLFIFNYMDYRIWSFYKDQIRGRNTKKGDMRRNEFFSLLGCSDFELDAFDRFYFSRTRKSLEHFYPRSKATPNDHPEDGKLSEAEINRFGNFAMIGAQINSAGQDLDPVNKVIRYTDSKADKVSVASLKFLIMMQKVRDNRNVGYRKSNLEWNLDDIMDHEERMLNLLFYTHELL